MRHKFTHDVKILPTVYLLCQGYSHRGLGMLASNCWKALHVIPCLSQKYRHSYCKKKITIFKRGWVVYKLPTRSTINALCSYKLLLSKPKIPYIITLSIKECVLISLYRVRKTYYILLVSGWSSTKKYNHEPSIILLRGTDLFPPDSNDFELSKNIFTPL